MSGHTAIVVEHTTEQFTADDSSMPAVGKWYWLSPEPQEKKDEVEPEEPWLACVTAIGSNYIELEGVFESPMRVHIDDFDKRCKWEPDANKILATRGEEAKRETFALMYKVREITSRLAITMGGATPLLGQGASEAQALVVRDGRKMDEYKAELARAQETELPQLFEEIKESNKRLAMWMKAPLIPMEAQAKALKPAIKAVKRRIFSVQLYAGLVEDVVQVVEGHPAARTEPVHLIQRRAYMDEECLAAYEHGGMDYRGIEDFDAWLARPANLDRVLPFPRCIIAFQVRRHKKDRKVNTLADLWRIAQEEKLDKLTFLYIRNGAQLFRLSTEIEFQTKLFPDVDAKKLNPGRVYARVERYVDGKVTVNSVISEHKHQEMVERKRRYERENAEAKRAWGAALKGKSKEERQRAHFSEPHSWYMMPKPEEYELFTPENVHYDEIAKYIADEVEQHNQLVLVLQGLLDRSPTLHPHPPWSLWSTKDFLEGLRLVYDDDRALTPGDKPDFEAYRAKLAESIEAGSVTIGQRKVWRKVEAIKEAAKRRGRGDRGRFDRDEYQPYNDPGPGLLARVARIDRVGRCVYEWLRPKLSFDARSSDVVKRIVVKPSRLFNVSAYKPGDFKQFFSDPRTRADYLQWAPMLLAAEDFHAGKRKADKLLRDKPAPKPRGTGSWKSEQASRRRERRKRLLTQSVELRSRIVLKSGTTLAAGELFRVIDARGDGFYIVGINKDGTRSKDGRSCSNASHGDLILRPDIPRDPADIENERKEREHEAQRKAERAKALAEAIGDTEEPLDDEDVAEQDDV